MRGLIEKLPRRQATQSASDVYDRTSAIGGRDADDEAMAVALLVRASGLSKCDGGPGCSWHDRSVTPGNAPQAS